MWTANIINKAKAAGDVELTVLYTDGSVSFTDKYRATTAETLTQTIKNRLAALEAADEGIVKITVGPVSPDAAPPSPVPPVADPQRIAFEEALGNLRKLNDLLSLGVIDPDNGDLAAALKDARASFDPKYLVP